MYSSEEEQIEAIKKWWRENGPAVIIGVVVGFGALFGWQGWQQYRNNQAEQAAAIYTNVMMTLETGNAAGNPASNPEALEASVNELQQEYQATPYAALASLAGAKAAVQRDDLEAAKSRLQWVVDNADQPELADVARLRLARLHIAKAEWDAATRLLNWKYPGSFSGSVNELLGDLHAAQGNPAEAREAYDRALSADVPPMSRELIQIKRDALAGAETATESAPEEAEPTNA